MTVAGTAEAVAGGIGDIFGAAISMSGAGAAAGIPTIAISTDVLITGIAEMAYGISISMTATDNLAGDIKKAQEAAENTDVSKGGSEAPYVKDKRVPLDRETVLSGSDYNKTNMKVKGATVYKNGDKYYYRDTLHTGKRAHLEVFDKKGNHLGEADPLTGKLNPNTADKSKKLKIK
ncbi:hypothetical protein C8E03_1451 [Lachnotalea glycerini]|uniref:Uncharacterized protein n=1 Tax=Lachnotalea glycerini TaxID=1763509 RepID=A0A318EII0_9FIRM|nr:hypothetical protein C8E03_1451 [Lachnotalea glycerini]